MNTEPEVDPVRLAAHNLFEKLKNHFWCDGGFLTCVAVGADDEGPVIYVMLSRKLMHHEKHYVPDRQDGIKVVKKVVGKPATLGGPLWWRESRPWRFGWGSTRRRCWG